MLTFLGIDYGDASLITLYLDVIGISIPKSMNRIIVKHRKLLLKRLKINMFLMDFLVTIVVELQRYLINTIFRQV